MLQKYWIILYKINYTKIPYKWNVVKQKLDNIFAHGCIQTVREIALKKRFQKMEKTYGKTNLTKRNASQMPKSK